MLQEFIQHYGYVAIFIGSMVEGEVALIIAGFAAYLGYLSLPWVIVVGLLGSLLSDQMYFYIGRRRGREFIESRPQLRKKAAWVYRIVNKYHNWVLLLFRFAYGFRAVVPFTLGTSNVSLRQFTIFNSAGAIIWSVLFSVGGYFFGTALEVFFGKIRHYELQVMGIIIIVSVCIWIFVAIRKHKILKVIQIDPNMII